MKELFENRVARNFTILAAIVLLMIGMLIHQSRRHLRLQKEIVSTVATLNESKELERQLVARQQSTKEKILLLATYEKQIPHADSGYVWVSRILREAVPQVALKIQPPDMSGQSLSFSPAYCAGTFSVSGVGRIDELLQILQRVEAEMPFARVQDLQFAMQEGKAEFSFSLTAVMKLNEDFES